MTTLIESWLHSEASVAVSAVLESLVMVLVLVLLLVVAYEWPLARVSPGVQHPRHCRRHRRPEAAVLGPNLLLPILLVLEELGL